MSTAERRGLPHGTEQRLEVIQELCERARRELWQAADELAEAGWPSWEVEALWLRRLPLIPKPPAVVTNAELARHGLTRHPEAVGVRWDDRGRATWVTCRECVRREEYYGLRPDEESEVLYRSARCDSCGQEVDAEDQRMKRTTPLVVIHGVGGELAGVFDSARRLAEIQSDEAFERPDVRATGEDLIATIRRRLRGNRPPAPPKAPA